MSANQAPLKKRNLGVPLLVATLVIAAVLSFVFYPGSKQAPLDKGAIIILPVKIDLNTATPLWQQYAHQESIIAQLYNSNSFPVLQVEDVISFLLQNSNYIEDTRPLQVSKLLTFSGASLVVGSVITKSDNRYQLAYNFYGPSQQQSGSIQAEDIESLYVDLAKLINDRTQSKGDANNNKNLTYFDNPLLILAIKQLQYRETTAASETLKQLLVSDADNFIAQRQWAEMLLKQQQFVEAEKILSTALTQAELAGNRRESARLGLTLAKSYIEQGELVRALPILSQSRSNAANSQDWLYLAYVAAWAGHVNERLGRYAAANQQYQLSVDYHNMVGYQPGQVLGLNNLAELAILEHNYSKAYKNIQRSVTIVTQKDLVDLKPETMALLTKVENKLQGTR
ncbi:hypothetical protein JK628_16125 [Shewanella sp. KX20019]|uniref:tetratricopeptide repeat protein n=1 Tax=Shewanella sp. KX20019 TaxID=2803864 RepID=UPI00192913B5|nr:hypothetical protein [Shewanella sp. KX20019]QQX79074.1 hypothetical protein JK628_16125 [Shewanella sp. KX20019]